jgi:hypothetical protein
MKWEFDEKQAVIHQCFVRGFTCHEASLAGGGKRTPKSISVMLQRHGYPYVMGSAAKC